MDQRIAEARRPYLTQGMLAAEILAGLAPGPESGVARSWLEASDGWAPSLIRLVLVLLASQPPPPPPPPTHGRGSRALLQQQQQQLEEDRGFTIITTRALSMLRKLGEKSYWPGDDDDDGAERAMLRALNAEPDHLNGQTYSGQAIGVTDLEGQSEPVNSEGDGKVNGSAVHNVVNGDGNVGAKAEAVAWKALLQNLIPSSETVLGALAAVNVDAVPLKQLCALAELDG
jgi:SWI/SNF chromatin-remodeling complex subunit SWI1